MKKTVQVEKEKSEIIIKNITEDFSKEIENKMKIIILVEHSKSYAKTYTFAKYINKKFQNKGHKYIIALAQEDFIDVDKIDSKSVISILKNDLNKNYNEFKERYPNALMEKAYSFNYAIDYSEQSGNAEIMSIALFRISDEFSRVQYSPIIPISKETYLKLVNKENTDEEGKLLHDILTEKVAGIELFGLIGYLTDGRYKTANLYMENLCDIVPDYQNIEGSRTKMLRYKKFRATKSAYIKSLKPTEE